MGNRGNYASRITEHPRASVLISLLDASLQKMKSEIFKKYEKSFLVLLDKVWGGGGAIILSASNVLTAGQQISWGRKYLD